jgi:hypothetical protein
MKSVSVFALLGVVLGVNTGTANSTDTEAQRIMSQYKEMELTSTLSRKNKGRIVWAAQQITFDDQDKISPQTTFKLTDPIWGRVYFHHSLCNTPVYGRGGTGTKPSENTNYGYEYRLFIDGQEKAYKFDVFLSANLNRSQCETWSTMQLGPNPIPFNDDFSEEAEAWRHTSQGMSPGTHAVRFELWGVQGQYRSREPISEGEFSLIVGSGDRVAAGGQFPEDSYRGSDVEKIRAAMAKAIVGPVAKSPAEVLKVAVVSDWKEGVYTDTKARYRKISGTVLWHDKNNDSVCRFTTYNFLSNHSGGNSWAPLRFKSFCNGCQEGDTECP